MELPHLLFTRPDASAALLPMHSAKPFKSDTTDTGENQPWRDKKSDASPILCDICGSVMVGAHCKLICERCGYTRDCSDP